MAMVEAPDRRRRPIVSCQAARSTAPGSMPGCDQKCRSSSASVARDDARRRLIDLPVAVFDALRPAGGFSRVAELGEEDAVPVVNDRGRRRGVEVGAGEDGGEVGKEDKCQQ